MSKTKKPAFGGYAITFRGVRESVEDVMGSTDLSPSEMTKKLWDFVKRKKLAGK